METLINLTVCLFIDSIRVCDNSVKLTELSVRSTTKGNWIVYRNGKYLTTVAGYLLDEETIETYHIAKA